MIRLEDLKPDMRVCGLEPEQVVEVIRVKPVAGFQGYGNAPAKPMGYTVWFKRSDGGLQEQTLYCRDGHSFTEAVEMFVFGENARLGCLAWEARRIKNAYLFDRYHTVFVSDIDPLPHQIEAVYEKMLGRHPLRFLLADDPGAGKTIMAGLLIREMMARDIVKRCLIVVPGNLAYQWKEELRQKFRLSFDVCDLRQNASCLVNRELVIARMDQAKRPDYEELLKESYWDLIVCDEAHKMSATVSNGEIDRTQRYRLGELLSEKTTHYLLMSATPHNGKEEDFQLFLRLLDKDRFERRFRNEVRRVNTSDLVLRRMKEELVTLQSKPLFPERKAYTADYDLSDHERELYEAVTNYCREEFNRAERLTGDRKNTVGFALTVLQRRLASSPEAIYQSLRSRRQRLEDKREDTYESTKAAEPHDDLEDIDDFTAEEREELEENIGDGATAAENIQELKQEIATLCRLEQQADFVRSSNEDSKWEKLREIWEDHLPEMEKNGDRRKLIIFSEHRATLAYLEQKLARLLGDSGAIVAIHGGIGPENRRAIQSRFQSDARVQVLVATDAAGEGINLQSAHLMVNYDLPWNPNRIEQRFGRIHRIGQTEVCHLWNVVTKETREGAVYSRLLEKLDAMSNSLGGKVFDVLGELFEEKSLRNLLSEAIRYGNDPVVLEKLQKQVENAVDLPRIQALTRDRVLAKDLIDIDQLRAGMDAGRPERLNGSAIRKFLFGVFDQFPDRVYEIRELTCGCYEIAKMPGVLVNHANTIGNKTIRRIYRHVCFDQDPALRANLDCEPEFVGPGHPLLEAAISWIQSHWRSHSTDCGEALPVLLDESTDRNSWRILFYLEWTISNADGTDNAIDRKAQFIEIDSDGNIQKVAASAYLTHEVARTESEKRFNTIYGQTLSQLDALTGHARDYAAGSLAEVHLREIIERETERLNRMQEQIKESLQADIDHERRQIDNYREQEQRYPQLSAAFSGLRVQAERRKEELEARLKSRMEKIARQRRISPSGIIARRVAIIIPAGLLRK
ncbi:MAG: helicase-related protein [Chloroflexi bacterium]|nr:helicase-related protein [Chloroflexota bacterium]